MNELLHCSASSRALVPRRRCLVLAGFTLKPAPATAAALYCTVVDCFCTQCKIRFCTQPHEHTDLSMASTAVQCLYHLPRVFSLWFRPLFAFASVSEFTQSAGRRAPLKAARKLCTMTDRLGTLPRSSPPAISAIFLWPLRGVWVWAVGVYTVSQGEGTHDHDAMRSSVVADF
jgi:hypothetical protein